MPAAILREPAVRELTGLATSTIYEKARKGEFPKPIKLGARASGWLASEISDWLEARIAASRPATAVDKSGAAA